MITLDLKWMLIICLLLTGMLVYGVVTAVIRHRQQSKMGLPITGSAKMRQQLDTAPLGLLVLNNQLQITYQNQTARQLLTPEAVAELQQDAAVTDGRATTRTLNLPDDRALSWWIGPVETGCLVLLHDLSGQRRVEKSSQLFLATVSHELRTPLTAVLAHVELLRSPDLPDSIRDNSLTHIQQETNRIARLVQDLLTLSRLETAGALELRPVDLSLIAESAISDIILAAEASGIHLSLQAEASLPHVLADADRLKQVFLNLLDNAVKYGRAGDKISVQLANVPEGVQVIVQDTGPGIPADALPHVAERLYRARPDVAGSGLGLAIVTEILRQHSSQLWLESGGEGQTGLTARFVLGKAAFR